MINKRTYRWIVALIPVFIFFLVGTVYLNHQKNNATLNNDEFNEGFDNPQGFYKYFDGIKKPYGASRNNYKSNYAHDELQKAMSSHTKLKAGGEEFMWTHRGPGNVGGRTRALVIDPSDATHKTWFAASASGGVWKTSNGGSSWQSLTDRNRGMIWWSGNGTGKWHV
jgi:hypothetical protein